MSERPTFDQAVTALLEAGDDTVVVINSHDGLAIVRGRDAEAIIYGYRLARRTPHPRSAADYPFPTLTTITCAGCGVRIAINGQPTAWEHAPECPHATPPSAYAWDSDCYSASYSPRIHLAQADTIGMADGLGITTDRDQMEWPVSWGQIENWGGKAGDEMAWAVEGLNLCYFSINGVRVARGERSPLDGSYAWTAITPAAPAIAAESSPPDPDTRR